MSAFLKTIVICVLLSLSSAINAQFWSNDKPDLLPEEEAFSVTASTNEQGLVVNWSIADGYYMYRESLKIEVLSDGTSIGEISYPKGVIEDDPEFGEVEVYF